MAKTKDIKYVNRNFADFKNQLVEFAKNYYPDSYNDFSPTSPGMMFIEMASYVGDVLSFYQDIQLQETFIQHAKNPEKSVKPAEIKSKEERVSISSGSYNKKLK